MKTETINKTKVNNVITEVRKVIQKYELTPLERNYTRCELLKTLEAKKRIDEK